MRNFVGLLIALAAVAGTPFSSAHAVQSAASDKLQLASQIIAITAPATVSLRTELRSWEIGLRAGLGGNPGITKIEAEHKGAIDAAVGAARPLASAQLEKVLAQLAVRKAEILAEGLTTEELREFHAFVISPAGRHFYASMHAKADVGVISDQVLDRAEKTGAVTLTEQDASKMLRSTLKGVQQDLSTADTLAIMKFEQRPVARKIAKVSEEAVKITLELANNPDPEWMERQRQVLTDAIIGFAEGKPNKR